MGTALRDFASLALLCSHANVACYLTFGCLDGSTTFKISLLKVKRCLIGTGRFIHLTISKRRKYDSYRVRGLITRIRDNYNCSDRESLRIIMGIAPSFMPQIEYNTSFQLPILRTAMISR